MKRRTIGTLMAVATLVAGLASTGFASAFGTLSNFDVVNDTGHECHGFEIELEDVHPSDVPYTFGGSYIRYGAPEVVDATVAPGLPRVIVRYRHWSGSQWEATPVAPAGISPSGHDCYAGGPVGNYITSGCEHYGVSLSANPTRTTYRWLIAANPADSTTAFSVAAENVNIPVPVWNVGPRPGGGIVVAAEVEPVEEEVHVQRGEPQWLKVFKIKSNRDLQPEDLDKLLLGLVDGLAPDDETEIETEWRLIQSKPGNAEGDEEDADVREDPLDAGERSVLRRYEFHRYTGPRDPENNEALPCIDGDAPVPDSAPLDGCSDLGDFVGAQNVAIDVGMSAANNPLAAGEVGIAYPDTALVTGGLPPYTVEVTDGAVPAGLQVDATTGILAGTPSVAGAFAFTIRVTDAAAVVLTAPFDVTVGEDLCPADPDKDAPGACGCGVPDVDTNANAIADCLESARADVAASVKQATARLRAGRRVRYQLRVTNLGPEPVSGATIQAVVAGGPFTDLRLPKGCSGSADAIVCSTGKLPVGRSAAKRISLIPAAGATISVTATVSSPLVDANAVNQTATVTTIVP